jgi:hypothetical protein
MKVEKNDNPEIDCCLEEPEEGHHQRSVQEKSFAHITLKSAKCAPELSTI